MLKKLFGLLEDEKKLQPGEWETIGTRFFGEEDFDNVPHWIQKRIRRIAMEGLGDSPQELTFEITGKTFIYRLDFDGPAGDILGVYRILKSPQAKKPGKEIHSSSCLASDWEEHNWRFWIHRLRSFQPCTLLGSKEDREIQERDGGRVLLPPEGEKVQVQGGL